MSSRNTEDFHTQTPLTHRLNRLNIVYGALKVSHDHSDGDMSTKVTHSR